MQPLIMGKVSDGVVDLISFNMEVPVRRENKMAWPMSEGRPTPRGERQRDEIPRAVVAPEHLLDEIPEVEEYVEVLKRNADREWPHESTWKFEKKIIKFYEEGRS